MCQLRSPVVTSRQSEVKHTLPTNLRTGKDRFRRFTPTGLCGTFLGIIQIVYIEKIGNSRFTYRTCISQFFTGDTAITGSDIGNNRKVLNTFVDIYQYIGVCLRVLSVVHGVMPLRATIGQCRTSACIQLAFIFAVGIVDADTACHIQPVQNLITQTCRSHITLLIIETKIAVSYPIRVLHT